MKVLIFTLRVLLYVFILSFSSLQLPAQRSNKVDSLLTVVSKESDLKERIKIYFQIANHYVHTNGDSAIMFNKLALDHATSLNIDSLVGQAYHRMAVVEAERNNYTPALIHADSAFKYFQLCSDTQYLAMVRNLQGGVTMSLGKNELSSAMYFDALRYLQNDTTNGLLFPVYGNLSILLNNMKKPSTALEYGMKQYNLAKRLRLNDEIGFACANIADTYAELDSPLAAKPFILELNSIAERSEEPYLKVIAKNQLGTVYLYEKNYSKAAANYIESLGLNNELSDQQLECNTLINLGLAYQKLSMLKQSDSCLLKAVETSKLIGIREERKDAYEQLAVNASLQDNYKRGFYFMQLFHDLSDSLLNEQNQQALIDAESKYESEKINRQIELLKAQSKIETAATERQRLIKNIIIASAVLLSIIAVLFFNRYQLKKKIESQQALLNERKRISRDLHDDVGSTLSSVRAYSEILRDNPNNPVITSLLKENATEMMERLEIIAWATNPQHDSFGNFIDKINRYALPICNAKNIGYHLFAENISRDVMMPGEIRQNLYLVAKEAINNTIKYAEANNCTIKTEIVNGKFTLEIKDDGKGFNDEGNDMGNGLKNMQSRIKEIGGELVITSAANEGTQIKAALAYPFKIPYPGKSKNIHS